VGRGERGAGGVGLDELDAGRRAGGVGRVEQQEEARVRGAEGGEVSGRAAGGHEAEEGGGGAGRGQVAPRPGHRIVSDAGRRARGAAIFDLGAALLGCMHQRTGNPRPREPMK